MESVTARIYVGDIDTGNPRRINAAGAGYGSSDDTVSAAGANLLRAVGSVRYHSRTTAGS